jgi:signal transduction histidine kinase
MSDRPVINVLVVDDTLANRWVLRRILEEAGYHVVQGETAADAIRLVADRPDLIVLDVRLPDGNGFELAHSLKADSTTSDIPLLLISASFTSPNERARGLDAGADGYLTHPVEPVVLLATIRSLIRARAAERALRESEANARAARSEADAARVAAEHANDVKAQFLAAMSHELRTPLNAIGGYVDLLELGIRGPVTDSQREDLDRIRRNQRHLLGLINNVLNFAKIEAGHVEYHIAETPLHAILEAMYSLVAPQLTVRSLEYEYRPCPPSLMVHADTEKVQQVLINLLSNAIKFTDPGGRITLEHAATDTMAGVRVIDTGLGIPAAKLEAIFEPFVQVDQAFTREGQGTGLGLSISRDLARAMGGDITVESVLGEGAIFTLWLPRLPMRAVEVAAADADTTPVSS